MSIWSRDDVDSIGTGIQAAQIIVKFRQGLEIYLFSEKCPD